MISFRSEESNIFRVHVYTHIFPWLWCNISKKNMRERERENLIQRITSENLIYEILHFETTQFIKDYFFILSSYAQQEYNKYNSEK